MDALADCLRHWRDRLDPAELGLPAGRRRAPGLRREEVFRVAGHVEPEASRIDRHITPGVQRILDRLAASR